MFAGRQKRVELMDRHSNELGMTIRFAFEKIILLS